MAGMDSEQIIGSCNAAGMHFLQDRAEYSGGGMAGNGNLAGGSILSRYSRPNGMAGMDSEQIIGSCNAAGMHFLQVRDRI
jgi:hypothetical protein